MRGYPKNSSQVASQACVVSASDATSRRSSLPLKRPDMASAEPLTPRTTAGGRPLAFELTPVGLSALRQLLERFFAVGFSKFAPRPVVSPKSWRPELDALSAAVGDLQT